MYSTSTGYLVCNLNACWASTMSCNGPFLSKSLFCPSKTNTNSPTSKAGKAWFTYLGPKPFIRDARDSHVFYPAVLGRFMCLKETINTRETGLYSWIMKEENVDPSGDGHLAH